MIVAHIDGYPTMLSVGQLLSRIAAELQESAGMADRCQVAIGSILPEGPSADVCEDLQGLDTLSQTLLALADVLTDLSHTAADARPLEAGILGSIRLSALRDRLAGVTAAGIDPHAIDLW